MSDQSTSKYSKLGTLKLKVDFEPVLRFFDVEPTGNLFRDVAALSIAMEAANIDEKLTRFFFDYYDADSNSYIDRNELGILIRDIGEAMDDPRMINITDQELDNAFRLLDKDGDNEITWEEFKSWFDQLMKAQKDNAQNK